MSPRHPALVLAACAGWLTLTTGYGAASPVSAGEPAVDLGGEPLPGEGTRTDPDNPVVVEAGLWADTLSGTTPHQFEYRRTIQESTVHIGVVGSPRTTEADGIGIEVTAGSDATSCASDDEAADISIPQAPIGAAVAVSSDDPTSPCLAEPTIRFAVDRGYAAASGDLPIAIKVVEEAPVTGAGGLPEPQTELSYPAPGGAGSPEERDGSASLADAPALEASEEGVALSTTLAEGEVRLYRVPVGWGQQVVATAEAPAFEDPDVYSFPDVSLRLLDPMRDSMALIAGDDAASGSYATEPLSLRVGTPPVRYLNRSTGTVPLLPGDYWVAVSAAPPAEDRDPIEIPLDLVVAVTGEVEDVPSHAANVLGPGDTAGPDGYAPEEPFLIGPGQFSAVASGSPVLPEDEADAWWGPRRYAGIGLAVVSLLACGLGARRLVR